MSGEINLKIFMLGDSNAGKTQFIYKYVDENFRDSCISTIGIEFKTKIIQINDIYINLLITDTIGQEKFRFFIKNCLKNADGVILFYDITNINSFYIIEAFYFEIEENYSKDDIKCIVVGNNLDLEDEREVPREMVNSFCERYNLEEIEVSS